MKKNFHVVKESHLRATCGYKLSFCNLFVYKDIQQKDLKRLAADAVKLVLYIYLYSMFMLMHRDLIKMIDIIQSN